jgi:GTP cyclohydrolase II
MVDAKPPSTYVQLTSHPSGAARYVIPIKWGEIDPQVRGPIIATTTNPKSRNAIGTHAGSYAIYRALAVAAGQLDPNHVPDFTNTAPSEALGPYATWGDPDKIVSMDPFGHMVSVLFKKQIEQGLDIRPTIAITKANINIPELSVAIKAGRLKPDGKILKENGEVRVTKAAIDPVWYLPGIAKRFGCDETTLRYTIFQNTGGMFTELITRPDLSVFLPPIGGMTVYFFGEIADINNPAKELTCRIHDECNGSDVFGSDICTCRPYLAHGIELCIQSAQRGGSGLIVYNRKEGRALGEVTKFLVYNARKRQVGGDTANNYFVRTECVAGVQDMRFQELMPDVLNWLGINKIDRFVSMSNVKYDAIIKQGITIKERVSIPPELIPADAMVEINAKRAAGYFSDCIPGKEELENTKGREL